MKTNKQKEEKDVVGFQARKMPPPPPPTQRVDYQPERGRSVERGTTTSGRGDTPTPRRYSISEQLNAFNCPEGVCLGYFRYGRCPRIAKGRPCSFKHGQVKESRNEIRKNSAQSVGADQRSRSISPVRPSTWTQVKNNAGKQQQQNQYNRHHSPSQSPVRNYSNSSNNIGGVECNTCGNVHEGVCFWNRECFLCGGKHAAKVCGQNRNVDKFGTERGRERRNSY